MKLAKLFAVRSFIFWGITPCSLLEFNRCFEGTWRLDIQGRQISKARKQHEAVNTLLVAYLTLLSCLAYSPNLKMNARCPSETFVEFRRTTCCYIPKENPFISTAMRTSDPTCSSCAPFEAENASYFDVQLRPLHITEGLFPQSILPSCGFGVLEYSASIIREDA